MKAEETDDKRDANTFNPIPVYLFEEEYQTPPPGTKPWPRPLDRPRLIPNVDISSPPPTE